MKYPLYIYICVCVCHCSNTISIPKSTKSTNQQQNQDPTGAAILRTSVGRGEGYAPLASALRGGSWLRSEVMAAMCQSWEKHT
jgi:hypothetical protein